MIDAAVGRPIITGDTFDLDPFDQFATVLLAGRQLREGMILVDPDLATPIYVLDHRMPAEARSRGGRWLVHNVESGRIETLTFDAPTAVYPVAAA